MIDSDGSADKLEFVSKCLVGSNVKCFFKAYDIVRDEVLKHGNSRSLFPTVKSIQESLVSYNFRLESSEKMKYGFSASVCWNIKQMKGVPNRIKILEKYNWWNPSLEYKERYQTRGWE